MEFSITIEELSIKILFSLKLKKKFYYRLLYFKYQIIKIIYSRFKLLKIIQNFHKTNLSLLNLSVYLYFFQLLKKDIFFKQD